MQIVVNPGSGPVENATVEQAEANLQAFTADLATRGHQNIAATRKADSDYDSDSHDGRFCWAISVDGQGAVEVQMPGIPLDQVR